MQLNKFIPHTHSQPLITFADDYIEPSLPLAGSFPIRVRHGKN